MRMQRIFLAVLWFVCAGPAILWAAEEATDTVTLRSRHIYESDVDAVSGKVTITESNIGYTHALETRQGMPVEFELNVGHVDIDDSVPTDLPSHLESRKLRAGVKFPAPFIEDDRFFMGFDIIPTFNTNGYRWQSGAFRIPFRSYLIFKESDEFILVGGVSVRPEYDTPVVPIVGLIYKPNERLSFNLASDDPHIAYKVSDATDLLWKFGFTLEEYEVTRVSQKGVVLKYRDISSGIGLKHRFNNRIGVALSIGGVFSRRLEYKDDVGKVVPDTGLYTDAALTMVF